MRQACSLVLEFQDCVLGESLKNNNKKKKNKKDRLIANVCTSDLGSGSNKEKKAVRHADRGSLITQGPIQDTGDSIPKGNPPYWRMHQPLLLPLSNAVPQHSPPSSVPLPLCLHARVEGGAAAMEAGWWLDTGARIIHLQEKWISSIWLAQWMDWSWKCILHLG